MTPPEPCLKHRCYSPTACNGYGYCRERNMEDADDAARQSLINERRQIAVKRSAKAAVED